MTERVTDIAIVGGGLVGTPLAIMLARQGWSVSLLEQHEPTTPIPGSRGYTALSHACVQLLKGWQLWEHAAVDACAIRQVHVSHKGYFGVTRIDSKQHGVNALGYVVDNAHFLESFQRALVDSSVHRLHGARVTQVINKDHASQVHFVQDEQEQCLSCKLLIAVDGVSSLLREAAGIGTQHTDYDQVGILGAVHLTQAHNHIAYERFTPSGPLALLPRPDNTASFVYGINPAMRDEMEALSDDAFLDRLQDAFGYRLGKFERVTKRIYVPLVRIEAARQVAERLVLLGNAMRLLHPVAGQGYNLAMRDVEQLVQLLADLSCDPGNANQLAEFADSRLQDHQQVVRMTDFLARGFRGSASLPAHIRALGLLGLDRVAPLRNRFVQSSMGHK